MRIRIIVAGLELRAELDDSATAGSVYQALPVDSVANRWGDEIYFDLPADATSENLKQNMDMGDLGYWIEGQALAVFFGRTPASIGDQPRAAVQVVHIGSVVGDVTILRAIEDGAPVRVESDG